METKRILGLLALIAPATAGGHWWMQKACYGELSDGPSGATIEITVGNLPASTASKPVYLSWWAAKESFNNYNPLVSPGGASVYRSSYSAYGNYGDVDYNGGKVRVNEKGEATVRVRPPSTYQGCRGGSARLPHVHFSVCGGYGRPQKIVFGHGGAYVKGGCWKSYSQGTQSYKVVSASLLDITETTTKAAEETTTKAAPVQAQQLALDVTQQETEKDMQEKDMDAIEFSPIYDCLSDTQLFDQFSSKCSAQCPSHADLANAQCVRKPVDAGTQAVLAASWHLYLNCNDKCWSDMVPVSQHMVRLALADHFDITFQEVKTVHMRKDPENPATHALLNVTIHTNRLGSELGSSLLTTFMTNSSEASELLGLTVHDVVHLDSKDQKDEGPVIVSDSNVPGETSDQYIEYYAPLEKEAEEKARSRGRSNTIAGLEVPEGVPVDVIIGVAAALMVLSIVVGIWLRRRRRQLIESATNADTEVKKVEDPEIKKVEDPEIQKVEEPEKANVEEAVAGAENTEVADIEVEIRETEV